MSKEEIKECGELDSEDDCIIDEKDITTIVLDDTLKIPDENLNEKKLLFKIVFSEQDIYKKLESVVIESLKDALQSENIATEFEPHNSDFMIKIYKVGEIPENIGFIVDNNPHLKTKNKNIEIPNYSKNFAAILTDEPSDDVDVQARYKGAPKAAQNCFNCGEEHNLRDCKKPRDHRKIGRARQMHVAKFERYHIEAQQRFGHFMPGQISGELQKALGLRKNELPAHIYKMRMLGYPPGWLEEAKVLHSGLTLFDEKGLVILDSEDEDGEVDAEKDKYDFSKIHSFPGFNVPAGRSITDDHKKFGAPAMLSIHSKEHMMEQLKDKMIIGYKRKKLKTLSRTIFQSEAIVNLENSEMEIEEGEVESDPVPDFPTLPAEDPPPQPPLPEDIPIITSSTTINQELENDDTVMTTTVNLNLSNSTSFSKSELPGTPLLKFSPYSYLPSGDKFSVGVCDVINFENLPDSTGKYERMKHVIGKVREKLIKLNKD